MGRYSGSQEKWLRRYREQAAREQGWKCYYCHSKFTLQNKPTAEHLVPHSLGGKVTRENIVASCLTCNLKMGTRHDPTYKKRQFKPRREIKRLWKWIKYWVIKIQKIAIKIQPQSLQ